MIGRVAAVSRRVANAVLVVSLVAQVSGCAAIIRGTHQRVRVTSEPPDARVTIDGLHKLKTPASIKLRREDDHLVVVELDGYRREEATLESEVSGTGTVLAVLGIFVWGIFEAVSVVTGSVFEIEPNRLHYVLEPVPRRPAEIDVAAPSRSDSSNGTCFAVSRDGSVLTSAELVQNAESIRVQFSNGRYVNGRLEAASIHGDVALLKTEQKLDHHLRLSSAALNLGDRVFSIGFDSNGPPSYVSGTIATAGDGMARGVEADFSGPVQPGAPVVSPDGSVVGVIASPGANDAAEGPSTSARIVAASLAIPLFEVPDLDAAVEPGDPVELTRSALCRVIPRTAE